MTGDRTTPNCLAPEVLAAFAEGKLPRRDIQAVLVHLDRCPHCMAALAAANDAVHDNAMADAPPDALADAPHDTMMNAPQNAVAGAPGDARRVPDIGAEKRGAGSRGARSRGASPWRPWLLAAAAVFALAAVLALPLWLRSRPPSGAARLAALLPRSARPVEPRLAGGFAWAPYRGPLRAGAGETAPDAPRLRLLGVAGELVEQADRDGSSLHQHDAGVALLLVEQPTAAVARLRAAVRRSPADAGSWSDLAAALYAGALRLARPSLYPEALAAADRALAIAPELAEARFNRALILERLGLAQPAREAWQRYLTIDPDSPWGAEARAHLARLPVATGAALFEQERPRIEAAARRGDQAAVEALAGAHAQLSRAAGELDYLGEWGEVAAAGDAARAAERLAIARSLGAALARRSGESLLADAVAAIDGAGVSKRAALAAAHALYRRARLAYNRQRPTAAEPLLREAARRLAAGGSPMALVARQFAANARFEQNDRRTARAELEALLAEVAARPRYAALGAEVRWELARCHTFDDDWAGAYPLLAAAAATFRQLGEWNHLAFIETMLAGALVTLGRPEDGWAANVEAFAILGAQGIGDRLAASLGAAARLEMRTGRQEPAASLLRIEEDVERAAGNAVLLSNALVRDAILSGALRQDERAAARVREAAAQADRIADPELRAAAQADVEFAAGASLLRTCPRCTRERLTRAIDFYRTVDYALFLPEGYLLRARASLQLGEPAAARRDLESGIATVERHRVRFAGSAMGTGVVDAGAALVAQALRLALSRGDAADAFAWVERAHAQLSPAPADPVSLVQVRRRLAGGDAAVLELYLLPRELVVLAVSARDVALGHGPLSEARLGALTARALAGDGEAERALYDLLLRPSRQALAGVRHLVVVAGPLLDAVPYAALYDAAAGRRLVETMSVALAPGAGALLAVRAAVPRSVAALALPAGDGGGGSDGDGSSAAALPEAETEVAQIGRLYPAATVLSGALATLPALLAAARRSDVVHVAGHTRWLDASGDDALLVSPGPGGGRPARVSWADIGAAGLSPSTVVCLAACATLRRPSLPQARVLSLGGGFLAAGAGDVIGTLAPIPDGDARQLFPAIHRQLAAGASAADAVRQAQLDALSGELAGGPRLAWRAVTLLTRRLPPPKV